MPGGTEPDEDVGTAQSRLRACRVHDWDWSSRSPMRCLQEPFIFSARPRLDRSRAIAPHDVRHSWGSMKIPLEQINARCPHTVEDELALMRLLVLTRR